MKNASRNKFLLCFRPVVDNMEVVIEPEGVGDGGGDRHQCGGKQGGNEENVDSEEKPLLGD
jgi:hypothetical protein